MTRYRARRKGEWVPEDRLRATLLGAALFVPVSVLSSGLITHYVEGRLGLGLNLVCLFFNGLGVSERVALTLAFFILCSRIRLFVEVEGCGVLSSSIPISVSCPKDNNALIDALLVPISDAAFYYCLSAY